MGTCFNKLLQFDTLYQDAKQRRSGEEEYGLEPHDQLPAQTWYAD